MRTRPIPINRALHVVKQVHRRLPKLVGGMWAIGVEDEGGLGGVAVVGRPTARMWNQDGLALEVTRVAVLPVMRNGCSMLYGACSRAAKAMGADNLFTYIHDDEAGTSLKAAGWIEDEDFESKGGQWSRPSRFRKPTTESGKKRRFFAPWSKYVAARSSTEHGARVCARRIRALPAVPSEDTERAK